ncbi:hypothetical protein CB1_000548037, partial [Camelus ferus]
METVVAFPDGHLLRSSCAPRWQLSPDPRDPQAAAPSPAAGCGRLAPSIRTQTRWFCEGRELHDSPDIQIRCAGGDLHTLVIAEAFEDDTGRYTCLATNPSGSDTTSAEVFIEAPLEPPSTLCPHPARSPPHFVLSRVTHPQKKTTSVSLTIGSSSPKTGVTTAVIQPLSVPVQQELQNIAASEGQVVVLECRVRGAPPLQVRWFRQGSEIQDSPDFRILQKKEICTLVIAETFPEDAGIFTCSASNDYGSVTSTAQLVVTSEKNCEVHLNGEPPDTNEDLSIERRLGVVTGPLEEGGAQCFGSELQTVPPNGTARERCLSPASTALGLESGEARGVHPGHGVNGLINGKADGSVSPPAPAGLPSPAKEPPPVLARPKLTRPAGSPVSPLNPKAGAMFWATAASGVRAQRSECDPKHHGTVYGQSEDVKGCPLGLNFRHVFAQQASVQPFAFKQKRQRGVLHPSVLGSFRRQQKRRRGVLHPSVLGCVEPLLLDGAVADT